MSSLIVTQGYGPWRGIIVKGYGWFLRVVKKIIEIVSRMIPVRRIPFKIQIPVFGDVLFPYKKSVQVAGDLAVPKKKPITLLGSPSFDLKQKVGILGDLSSPIELTKEIKGSPAFPVESKIPAVGDLQRAFKGQIKVTGKKDIRELLRLLLEEDEEE